MSVVGRIMRFVFARNDKKRDENFTIPENVEKICNITYAQGGEYNLLDVYRPKGCAEKLPVIVSIHGGGYVYAMKEVYQFYCSSLVKHGFAVINFNYTLAPKAHFPTQLAETNAVMEWIADNASKYLFDADNVFIVGDSAGAQMASHYCALYSNPEFAALFPFSVAKGITVRAAALNCGMYEIIKAGDEQKMLKAVTRDYLGRGFSDFDMIDVYGNITDKFPPTFVMTSQYDFLKPLAKPMYELLVSRNVECEYRLYGEEGQKYMGHVFHVNIAYAEAEQCNADECKFFMKYYKK